MIKKTYELPEGSEEIVDNLVKVGIERFLRQQHETKVEDKPEFQQAVDSALEANSWDKKYEIKKEPIDEKPIEPIEVIN